MKRIAHAFLTLTALCWLSVPAISQVTSVPCNQLPAITGDVTRSAGSCASTLAAGSASNLNSGTLAVARGGTGVGSVAGIQAALSQTSIGFKITAVDFNSGNTDNAIAITLPTGYTRYRVTNVILSHASGTLTTATCGVFTATGAGGTAIVASGTAITVSTASESTNNNTQNFTIANSGTTSYTEATLYFRVQNPQGSAATGDVILVVMPVS